MVTLTAGIPRKFSAGDRALAAIFQAWSSDKAKKDQKNKGKDVKILKNKYNVLDEAYPTFLSFLEDPMALSHFKSYLHAKVCVENLLFYENIVRLREIEGKQSTTENLKLVSKIYQDFFQSGPAGAHVLNVDSALMREITEAVNNVAQACTSAIFKNALDLVLHQMQTEWYYFKQAPQGHALLENLNNGTFFVLPDPTDREPIALPQDWTPNDDPVNWGLSTSGDHAVAWGLSTSAPIPSVSSSMSTPTFVAVVSI